MIVIGDSGADGREFYRRGRGTIEETIGVNFGWDSILNLIDQGHPLYIDLFKINGVKEEIELFLSTLSAESVDFVLRQKQRSLEGEIVIAFEKDGIIPNPHSDQEYSGLVDCEASINFKQKVVYFVGISPKGWKYRVTWLNFQPSKAFNSATLNKTIEDIIGN